MQSRFKNISASILHADSLAQLGTDTSSILSSVASSQPLIGTTLSQINETGMKISALKSRDFKDAMTPERAQSDHSRDTLYRVIKNTLVDDVKLGGSDPVTADSAEDILAIWDANPVNLSAPYADESAQLDRLIAAIETKKDILNKTSAVKRFALLKTEQATFEKLRLGQNEAKSDALRGELLPELKTLAFQLNSVLNVLELLASTQKEVYENPATKIETLVNSYVATARASQTRKANQADKSDSAK